MLSDSITMELVKLRQLEYFSTKEKVRIPYTLIG